METQLYTNMIKYMFLKFTRFCHYKSYRLQIIASCNGARRGEAISSAVYNDP